MKSKCFEFTLKTATVWVVSVAITFSKYQKYFRGKIALKKKLTHA